MLSGCAKSEKRLTDRDRLKIKIHKARLSDVPIPLGAIPQLKLVGEKSFGYLLGVDETDLVSYYQVEMEQHGWRLLGQFDSVEKQLIFEKPHKLSSISIRTNKDKYQVLILISDR